MRRNDQHRHSRRSIRLRGYDYTQVGAYFVTLCTWQRECLFGEVVEGVMRLSPTGRIIEVEWQRLGYHFPHIRLDAFVVMPNHLHGIIIVNDLVGATRHAQDGVREGDDRMQDQTRVGGDGSPSGGATRQVQEVAREGDDPVQYQARVGIDGSPLRRMRSNGPPAGSLGAMIGQFKSRATKRIWARLEKDRTPVWQRNYYEHIIRDEADLRRIREYIQNNAARWDQDQLHPAAPPNRFIQEKHDG